MYQTTLNSVMDLLGDKYEKCESLSPSLRLTKFVRLQQNDREEDKGIKREEINAVCDCAEKHHYMAPEIAPKGSEFVYGKLLSRLIVNQAGGVLENSGLCLHRFFGYPMIPGGAVKGIASHVAWCEWNDIPEEESARKLAFAEKIASVFGYPTNHKDLDDKLAANLDEEGWKDKKYSGTICFLDAVPYECNPRLVTDIITCHHKDYYEGKKDKAIDDEQLKLIPFLAVDKDATFKFTLVPLARCNDENMADAKKWLLDALTIHGAGAKTAAGYGWFVDVSEKIKNDLQDKREREEREAQQRREREEREAQQRREREESKNNLDQIESRIKELECVSEYTLEHRKILEDIQNELEKYNGRFNYQFLRDKLNRLNKLIPKGEETYKDKLLKMNDKEILDNAVKLYTKRNLAEQEDIISYFMNEGKDRLKKYNSGNLEGNKSKNDIKKCSAGLKEINEGIRTKRKGV